MSKKYAVGIDIGGSHISSILVDLNSGDVLVNSLSKNLVNNKADVDTIISSWGVAISNTINCVGIDNIDGLGFAIPGPFDYENGIALLKDVAKYDSLYGVNVGDKIREHLQLPSHVPIRFINDALSFAIGETWKGIAKEKTNVVAITLGTGFGSSFCTDGIPVIEGLSVPNMGYVYHIPYENSIADDYFSTRWFIKEYEAKTGQLVNGVKDIANLYLTNTDAQSVINDFGNRLGCFMSPLLKQFNADALVIGGNISKAYPLFGASLKDSLQQNNVSVELMISELGEEAAMTGAARLIDESYWKYTAKLVSKI